jgi:aldehyde:ferredoxin oxidoreductase
MAFGERRINLTKVYNVRESVPASADTLPERFFTDTITVGRWQNHKIDKTKFDEMIKTYYAMMGWDEDGVPTITALLENRLEWVVDEGHLSAI